MPFIEDAVCAIAGMLGAVVPKFQMSNVSGIARRNAARPAFSGRHSAPIVWKPRCELPVRFLDCENVPGEICDDRLVFSYNLGIIDSPINALNSWIPDRIIRVHVMIGKVRSAIAARALPWSLNNLQRT